MAGASGCSTKRSVSLIHLDLEAQPSASAAVVVDDDIDIRRRLADHTPVPSVNAPLGHWRYLVERQRLQ